MLKAIRIAILLFILFMVAAGTWLDVEPCDYLVDRTLDGPRWDGRVVRGFHFELLETCILPGVGSRASSKGRIGSRGSPSPWAAATAARMG